MQVQDGLVVGRPDLTPADEAEFRKGNFKLVDADDMGPAPGALRAEDMGLPAATK